MKQFSVRVQIGQSEYRTFTVQCSSPDDAIQIAFALNCRWKLSESASHNATRLLEMANGICKIIENKHPAPEDNHDLQRLPALPRS